MDGHGMYMYVIDDLTHWYVSVSVAYLTLIPGILYPIGYIYLSIMFPN